MFWRWRKQVSHLIWDIAPLVMFRPLSVNRSFVRSFIRMRVKRNWRQYDVSNKVSNRSSSSSIEREERENKRGKEMERVRMERMKLVRYYLKHCFETYATWSNIRFRVLKWKRDDEVRVSEWKKEREKNHLHDQERWRGLWSFTYVGLYFNNDRFASSSLLHHHHNFFLL